MVTYTYDAWGKLLSTTGSMASTLGALNPLRYRGYVYDTESGLYYLQSRYYNPDLCRFINADDVAMLGADGHIVSANLFAYCNNNPIINSDASGNLAILSTIAIVGIGISSVIGGAIAGINTAVSGGSIGEIIASSAVGAVTSGAIATVAAVAAATGATAAATAVVVDLLCKCGAIGAAGEAISLATEYAFHRKDPNYHLSGWMAFGRIMYAGVMGALGGYLSYGISSSANCGDIGGTIVSAEASFVLGCTDLGIRQVISGASSYVEGNNSVGFSSCMHYYHSKYAVVY